MTRVDEFDHFFSSTSDVTLKATYAVCGDRNVAFESTVDAYCRAWRDWTKIRNHNPDGWVRTEACLANSSFAWYSIRSTMTSNPVSYGQTDCSAWNATAHLRVPPRYLDHISGRYCAISV